MALLAACLTLGPTGCDDDTAHELDTAMSSVDVTTTDDIGEPLHPVRFVIENVGTAPLYVQLGIPDWMWVNVRDATGAPIQLSAECGVCPCGMTTCPICFTAQADALSVRAGRTWSFEWDGRIWSRHPTEHCATTTPAPAGTYTATFCWGSASVFDPIASNTHIGGMECATRTFELGTDTEVRQQVSVEAPSGEVDLTLRNETDLPIYYQALPTDDCSGEPGWFTITDRNGAALDTVAECGECLCVYGPDCTDGCHQLDCRGDYCDPRCQGWVLEIGAHGRLDATWSAHVPVMKTLAPGWTCVDHVPVPAGELSAQICWGTSHDGNAITDPICESRVFTLDPYRTEVVVQHR